MTSAELAQTLARIQDTDDPRQLARLEAELRALGDPEAESVARAAGTKRRRITGAN